MSRILLTFLAWLIPFGTGHSTAPYAFRVTVDRDTITVGDPLTLTLVLEFPEQDIPEVIPEIRLPDVFRVLGSPGEADQRTEGGRVKWEQGIQLTSYRTGEQEISDLDVLLVLVSGDTVRLSDSPISILVRSVKPDSLSDILDVKAPMAIDAEIPVWVWLVLIVLIVLAVSYVLWRRRAIGEAGATTVVVVVNWFDEVKKLQESGLIEAGDFDSYYTRLSEALRRYIEQRTGVEAMERATFEIRGDLERADLSSGRILEVEGFLDEAELVKFAKFEPDSVKARQDGDLVLALMDGIDDERTQADQPELKDEVS